MDKTINNTNLLSRAETARWLHQSPKTLTNWASSGIGPPYRRIGRAALYLESDLISWMEAQQLVEEVA
ncbi:helix-turn-helix domain-containing protein [Arthrobacter sp. KK5.5]|uniref:helix-turn-helix domain-containing protein n=1 Tax=Arthrobacter sp. KK5.5 TaxID=3373084 RepID=UPI003EE7AD73